MSALNKVSIWTTAQYSFKKLPVRRRVCQRVKKETIQVSTPCSSCPIRSITALAPSSVMSISKGAFELKQRSGESKKALAAWTSPSNSSQDACRATINPYRRWLSHKEKKLQSSRSTRVRKKYPCAYQAALHRYTTSRLEIEMREKACGA